MQAQAGTNALWHSWKLDADRQPKPNGKLLSPIAASIRVLPASILLHQMQLIVTAWDAPQAHVEIISTNRFETDLRGMILMESAYFAGTTAAGEKT